MAPCRCKGSSRLVHEACLMEWYRCSVTRAQLSNTRTRVVKDHGKASIVNGSGCALSGLWDSLCHSPVAFPICAPFRMNSLPRMQCKIGPRMSFFKSWRAWTWYSFFFTCIEMHTHRERKRLLNDMYLGTQSLSILTPYLASLGGSLAIYIVSTTYGAWALVTMLGSEEGERLLGDTTWGWRTWCVSCLCLWIPLFVFTLCLSCEAACHRSGLPFIPLTLILSRLDPSGSALTLVPLILLSSSSSQLRIRLEFPPSPSLAFVLFPWVRIVYLRSWETVRRWDDAQLMRTVKDKRPASGNHGPPRRGQRRRDGLRLIVGALAFPGTFLFFSFDLVFVCL